MIRVPTVDQASIAPQGMPDARIGNQVSAAGMGADIGAGLQQLGSATEDLYQREQYKANVASENQMRLDLAQQDASLNDPSNPQSVYQFKGENAQQVPGFVRQQLSDFYSKYQQNLKNPVQQEMFSRLFATHQLGVLDRANHYALAQTDEYQHQTFEGAVGSALSAATTKAQSGDAEGSAAAQADGVAAIQQYGKANGWAPEYTQYSVDKFQKSIQSANEAAAQASAEAYAVQDPQNALHDAAARLGLGQYGPSAKAVNGNPDAPRGIRNNNPGNIQQTGVAWQGKVASTDPRYEAFASPELGIRALALNAQHLQAGGAQTVGQLIGKWSPASENGQASTDAYVADVSTLMGVSPDAPVNLRDPQQLTALTNAIITHENSQNPYTPQQMQDGVSAALGKSKLPDVHPPVTMSGSGLVVTADGVNRIGSTPPTAPGQLGKSGNPLVDNLDTAHLVAFYNRAREEVNRGQLKQRGAIEQRVVDDTAAFHNGQPVSQPLTIGDFTQAYGDTEGMTKYGAYQANQQLGQDLQTVATLSPKQMSDLAQARAPQPGENYAVKEGDQKSLLRAIQQTTAVRQKDPVAWAQQANVGNLPPLDTSSPTKLAASIAGRAGPMTALSQKYQMPRNLLSDGETTEVTGMINAQSAKDKAATLGALSTSLQPNDYADVVSALKKNSPTTSIAGQIMGAGRVAIIQPGGAFHSPVSMDAATIAQTMLDGDALINPTKADKDENGAPKMAMPSDSATSGLRSVWNTVVGDAYRGDGQGEMQAYQAFRSMYAGLAARQGKTDGILDNDIATQAARATVGNVVSWNGKHVIPPYGMDENTFKDAAQAQWQAQRANVPGADQQDLAGYDLDQIGRGVYTVSNGMAPLRDKDWRPVVLRINAANAVQIAKSATTKSATDAKPGVISRTVDAVGYGLGHIPLVSTGNDGS